MKLKKKSLNRTIHTSYGFNNFKKYFIKWKHVIRRFHCTIINLVASVQFNYNM